MDFSKKQFIFSGMIIVLIIASTFWILLTSAPNKNFPTTFSIEAGTSLKRVTSDLKQQGIIRSTHIANMLVILSSGDGGVVSGDYQFTEAADIFSVVKRITTGEFGIDLEQIRIPEGATVEQIGFLFEERFTEFDRSIFTELTKDKEGVLFPDTYFFLKNVKAEEVVETLEENFADQLDSDPALSSLRKQGSRNGTSLRDVIIMASIIEKEATAEARQEVSNILWERITIGMALQVDATFVYSIGKGTFDLYIEDLEDESNPYNSYTHRGLPPTAIGNPGLASIKAAANPQPTDNLYFLTGHDGEMYYATNFDDHVANKRKHLK